MKCGLYNFCKMITYELNWMKTFYEYLNVLAFDEKSASHISDEKTNREAFQTDF